MARYLFADCETHNAGREYSMPPHEFVRLFQWAWDNGDVQTMEVHTENDIEQVRDIIRSADYVVFHNGISADLGWIFGPDSIEPVELALQNKVIDTLYLTHLLQPCPASYTNREGKVLKSDKPGTMMKYYSLDNVAFQFGVEGKFGDIKALARKYNPEGTKVEDLDFSLIPLDDPEFLEYARQDVVSTREILRQLRFLSTRIKYDADYIWREMLALSIAAQMSRNGWTVDVAKAQARVDALEERKTERMKWLVSEFDFPTKGSMPWRSNDGKNAIVGALRSFGIDPVTAKDWPQGKTGPSLAGDVIKEYTEGTDAEELGEVLAELQGQRPLAAQALDNLKEDGKVHISVTALQRSGRFSITKPSLTTWTARGKNSVEKEYFVASPGRKLVEADLSNADQRIVAALSGDRAYAERFEPGADGHEITGRLMFGDEAYEADMPEGWQDDPELRKKNPSRQVAKALSHAFAYGAGPRTLANTARKDKKATEHLSDDDLLDMAKLFVETMNREYPDTAEWRRNSYLEAESGWVTNVWGRRMKIDTRLWSPERKEWYSRAFTQGSAMYGQSGTHEILKDGLIRIAKDKLFVLRWLVATVHDAVVWDIPESELGWAVPYIVSQIETTFDPKQPGTQPIFFPLEAGEPADDWFRAGH